MGAPVSADGAVVIGGGPAGRAIAHRLAHHGVRATLVDPAPDTAWPATYGMWAEDRPAWLPHDVVAADLPDAAVIGPTGTAHAMGRTYSMLSTTALQSALHDPRVQVRGGTVAHVAGGTVVLDGQPPLTAAVVIDAAGVTANSRDGSATTSWASQTAFGMVLPDGDALPASSPLAFMDWRADHGHEGWPSFLYAVPLGMGRVLVEETSLARRPGLPIAVLERRLRARMAARGVPLPDEPTVERVGFRVDRPRDPGRGRVVTFGAAAPLMHPATGYSVGASLQLADPVAAVIADALHGRGRDAPAGPRGAALWADRADRAARAARGVIWTPGAIAVHHMRSRGLEALLALPPAGVGDFFECFFQQSVEHQRAYLSTRDDPVRVAMAMWAVFRAADGPLRRHLARWGGVPVGRAPAVSGTIRD